LSTDAVVVFREQYRGRIASSYSHRRHLALSTAAGLLVVLAALSLVRRPSWLELLAIPLTLLYANLAEHLAHRFPLHHRLRGLEAVYRRHTLEHHRFFTARAMSVEQPRDFQIVLIPPAFVAFFLLALAVPVGAGVYWLASLNAACLFVAASGLYVLNYEWFHFAYHVPEGHPALRSRFLRRARERHRAHHDPARMTRVNFNLTYPWADRLLGTLENN
jgi:hypothetical protein